MAQYGTGRKPHTCWRCKALFDQEMEDEREKATNSQGKTQKDDLPLFREFYGIFRKQGTSAVKDWIDERYKKPHRKHKKSWV